VAEGDGVARLGSNDADSVTVGAGPMSHSLVPSNRWRTTKSSNDDIGRCVDEDGG
jgi:hypothetical protein